MNLQILIAAFLSVILISAQSNAIVGISLNFPGDGTSVSSKRIRVAGKATPNSKVFVNEVEMYVHSSGTFAGIVDLNPGDNILKAKAVLDGQTAEVSVKVKCTIPLPPGS